MRKEGIKNRIDEEESSKMLDDINSSQKLTNSSLEGDKLNKTKEGEPLINGQRQTYYKWFWFDKYLCAFGAIAMISSQIYFGFHMQHVHKHERKIAFVKEGMFGFDRENSDFQWRAYSDNFGLMVACIIVFCSISELVKKVFKSIEALHNYYIIFGMVYLIFLFRGNIIFWLFFTGLNYLLIEYGYKYKTFPMMIWILNLVTIYCNDTYHGYNLVNFFHCESLQFLVDSNKDQLISWHSVFNMTILRMISFGMDKHWSFKNKRFIQFEAHIKKCQQCSTKVQSNYCLKYRYDEPHGVEEFTFKHYLSYLVYTPLFITGPPLTFNAFVSQLKYPSTIRKEAIRYSLRALFSFVLFEIWIHIDYSFAITTREENSWLWETFSPGFFFICSYSSLVFIWFKFNTIWKIARAWALWDNMEAPENMNRCVANNNNFEAFWRSWHRGFNQWLLRYIYFPLGGSKTKVWNIWVVFTFVAVWHDLNLNLLFWAWGICLCLIPEIGVKRYFEQAKFKALTSSYKWKYICSSVACWYVLYMSYINLIGFGMGWKTINMFLVKSFSTIEGILEFLFVLFIMFFETLAQFYIRDREDDPEKGF